MMMLNRVNPIGLSFRLREIFGNPDKTSVHVGEKSMVVPMSIREMDVAWHNWANGAFVQNAFSALDVEQREFLQTGLTPEEFEAAAKQFDEEEK